MFYNKKEIKSSSVVLIQHLCNKPLNLLSFYIYEFYGLNPKDVFPGVLKGAAKLANSHNNRLVSRGSIISSASIVILISSGQGLPFSIPNILLFLL